jgi:hypothetical protein
MTLKGLQQSFEVMVREPHFHEPHRIDVGPVHRVEVAPEETWGGWQLEGD